jgi:class 3 adenylate cyclase
MIVLRGGCTTQPHLRRSQPQLGLDELRRRVKATTVARKVTDLTDWLNELDLDRYAQTFAENHVEYTTLSDLTENDLKNLGVSLGHRKRMLRAIEAMTLPDESDKSSVSSTKTGALPHLQRREAELRQITVMFCDLVGSTQLSGKLEPEDLQIILEAYRNACRAAISRYDGRVAGNFGDGVMAYFGWPRAHEDDAVRAVYAALEILPSVMKISAPATLAVRVGICSGPAVVGEVGSSGTASLMDAVGETPNVAARLQTLAAPNTVLIAQSTKRLLSAAFDLEDLGLQELKGVIKPLHVYRVLAAKNSPSRFEAAHAGSLTPLVGRSTELTLLFDRWQKASSN